MSGVWHAVTHPAKAVKHLVHNPASALVSKPIRDSGAYRSVVRPAIKIGTGALEGFLVGGPAGAAMGAGAELLGGGLTNKPFRPGPNLVGPLAAAAGGSYLAGTGMMGGLGGSGMLSGLLGGGGAASGASAGASSSGLFGLSGSDLLGLGKDVFGFGSQLAGVMSNKKVMAAQKAARDAALAGDMTAYNKAIAELNKEIARAKAGALYDVGSAGFVTNRGQGSFYGNVAAQLSADARRRANYLRQNRDNMMRRTRAAASADLARSKAGMLTSLFGAGQAGLGILGRFL